LSTGTVDFCEVCLKLQHHETTGPSTPLSFLTVSVGSSGVDFIFKTKFLKTARNNINSSGKFAASEQLVEVNEKLAVQNVAVTKKTESCEILLVEISERTSIVTGKKQLALGKKTEIAEQNGQIVKEKVRFSFYKRLRFIYKQESVCLQNGIRSWVL